MITGPAVATLLRDMEISHVVTVPDGTIGRWEGDIEKAGIQMVRVCREGEAWTVAGGLEIEPVPTRAAPKSPGPAPQFPLDQQGLASTSLSSYLRRQGSTRHQR